MIRFQVSASVYQGSLESSQFRGNLEEVSRERFEEMVSEVGGGFRIQGDAEGVIGFSRSYGDVKCLESIHWQEIPDGEAAKTQRDMAVDAIERRISGRFPESVSRGMCHAILNDLRELGFDFQEGGE
jgi:hypothetical protein